MPETRDATKPKPTNDGAKNRDERTRERPKFDDEPPTGSFRIPRV